MDQLDQIKSKIDIVTFLSEYITVKRAGRNFKALCPFHGEKTPSFVISPERQIWHCFGACNEGGDIFKFLMKIENIEFPEALKILAERAGVKLQRFESSQTSKLRDRLYEINHLASEFYHYLLTSHPIGKKALSYLENERKISQKIIKTFKLGYAPNLWDGLICYLNKKKQYPLPELDAAGLIIRGKSSYYDRFRNRIIFPLSDHRSNISGFSGRSLNPDEKSAKYINTSETSIYHKGDLLFPLNITKDAIKKNNLAIVVEGEFDALSSFQAGNANVIAVKGSALTQNQANLLKRFTENVALALDSDAAGSEATIRGIETAETAGLFVKIIEIPFEKDPDELIKKSPLSWQKAIKSAIPIYDFYLNSYLKKFDPESPDGKKKITDNLLPIFNRIDNLIIKSHYLKKLSLALDLNEETLELASRKIKTTPVISKTPLANKSISRQMLLEELVLSLLVQNPDLFSDDIANHLCQNDFSLKSHQKIYQSLSEFRSLHKDFQINDFAQNLPKELIPQIDKFYLNTVGNKKNDDNFLKKELLRNIYELKKINLKNSLLQIGKDTKNPQDLPALNEQFKKIVKALKNLN